MSLEIHPFYERETGSWSYLLLETGSARAAMIDPVWVFDPVSGLVDAGFVDGMTRAAAERGCRIDWVLETHAHADHLTAADYLRRTTGARVGIGQGICDVQVTFRGVFNLTDLAADGSQFDRLLAEGDRIALGGTEIHVLETPGHTSDSVTYLTGKAAFIGDTLFAPHYGTARCDFPGGDAGRLYDSIRRLHALPDDTELYFCHDYPDQDHEPVCCVTVAESRRSNVHVNERTEREAFVAMRRERDATLELPRLILPSVQVNIRAGAAPPADNNGVAYLRLPFNRPLKEIVQASRS